MSPVKGMALTVGNKGGVWKPGMNSEVLRCDAKPRKSRLIMKLIRRLIMKLNLTSVVALCCLLALPCMALGGWSAQSTGQADEDLAFSIGVQAYVWGYPLVISGATALVATNTDKPLPNAHAPFNTFGHMAKLFTAKDKDVVSLNVDTVYSSAFLDLKQGAALVSVPDTDGRYYSLMLEDAYTNVFGYIGHRATGEKAGTYLITGPAWKGTVPNGVKKIIAAPTSFVWVIGRTLVDNEADMKNVRKIQEGYELKIIPPELDKTPIKERWGLNLKPKLVPVHQVDALDWKSYYHWLGQLMMDNPPPQSDSALYAQFSTIGLSVENGFDPSNLSKGHLKGLQKGYEAGKGVVKREALKTGSSQTNGWAYNLDQGKWGQNFNLRAGIAYRSLGHNTAEEALYFNTREDGNGKRLNGQHNYTLSFKKGMQPPVEAFWSITIYNAQNFLVDNPINRYAIGNRTPNLKSNKDGSLTIYIQKNPPADDKKVNWLPAPEGDFRLSMRLYIPEKAVLDGKWKPAAVTKSN